jgi:hypothetical protein
VPILTARSWASRTARQPGVAEAEGGVSLPL